MGNLLEIPWDALAPDTLSGLVEEFVTREGTDYGEQEMSLERKVLQVIEGIRRKQYVVVFDTELESSHIMTREQWRKAQSASDHVDGD